MNNTIFSVHELKKKRLKRRCRDVSGRGMASNVELLTHSYKVVKAKKRTKLGKASAVVFDEDARRCVHMAPFRYSVRCMTLQSREFLTGFHKRKLAKKEEGKKRAQAREKEERLNARREVRRALSLPLRFVPPTLESPTRNVSLI